MPSPIDPPPNDQAGLAAMRAHYDRRRRRLRVVMICGVIFFTGALGGAGWLFVRYPLRWMQEQARNSEVRELKRDAGRLMQKENPGAAADLMRERLARMDRERDPKSWAQAAHVAASLYASIERYEDAHEVLNDALPWAEQHPTLGPEATETMELRESLAEVESELHHDDVAEPLLQRVVADAERILGAGNERTLMALNNYGWFLIERHRAEEAEPLLLRSLEGMEKTGRGNTGSMASVLDSVAHLRDQQGRFAEALELQRRAAKLARTHAGTELHIEKITDYLDELEARTPAESK